MIAMGSREGFVREREPEDGRGAQRRRAVATARNGLDADIFAARLSLVLRHAVPAHVINRLEAGVEVDWGEFDYDVLDLYLAMSEVAGRSLSELFHDQAWVRLNEDVDRLYAELPI